MVTAPEGPGLRGGHRPPWPAPRRSRARIRREPRSGSRNRLPARRLGMHGGDRQSRRGRGRSHRPSPPERRTLGKEFLDQEIRAPARPNPGRRRRASAVAPARAPGLLIRSGAFEVQVWALAWAGSEQAARGLSPARAGGAGHAGPVGAPRLLLVAATRAGLGDRRAGSSPSAAPDGDRASWIPRNQAASAPGGIRVSGPAVGGWGGSAQLGGRADCSARGGRAPVGHPARTAPARVGVPVGSWDEPVRARRRRPACES